MIKFVILTTLTLLPQNTDTNFHSYETYSTRRACERVMYEQQWAVVRRVVNDMPGQRYIVISKCEEQ